MSTEPEKRLNVTCTKCRVLASSRVAGRVVQTDDEDWDLVEVHSLVGCANCGHPLLVVQYPERNHYDDSWEEGPPHLVWPEPRRSLSIVVPERVRDDFLEATKCIEATAYVAAVAMVRRGVESVCGELEPQRSRKDLQDRINDLAQSGLIDPSLREWAHELRLFGNKAAHSNNNQQFTRETAEDALSFLEALADYSFTFKRRLEEFRDRRKNPPPRPPSAKELLERAMTSTPPPAVSFEIPAPPGNATPSATS